MEEIRDEEDETIAQFFSRVFNFVQEHDVERLVLDLSENSGGNLELNGPVLHGLIACPKVNYPGGLLVIIGRDTYSAGMNLAVSLERHTHSLFVGEPTGAPPNHFGDTQKYMLFYTQLTVEIVWSTPETLAPFEPNERGRLARAAGEIVAGTTAELAIAGLRSEELKAYEEETDDSVTSGKRHFVASICAPPCGGIQGPGRDALFAASASRHQAILQCNTAPANKWMNGRISHRVTESRRCMRTKFDGQKLAEGSRTELGIC